MWRKQSIAKEPAKALLSISRYKEKVCRAFTGSVFTCSSLATQRGESMNSVIKENGFKKKELRRFNLLQLAEHLWSIFQRQEIKACDELVTLLVAKRRWSNYVDGLWRANVLKAETLPHVTEVGGIWYVSGSHFDDVADAAHRIVLGQEGGHPSCDCYEFKSSKIPCAGICQVFCRIDAPLLCLANLHPRWRLESHPMYSSALCRLNINDPAARPSDAANSVLNSTSNTPAIARGVSMQSYEKVKVPATTGERIMKIRDMCTRIENAVASTPHTYRLFMANLSTWVDGLRQSGYSGGLEPFTMPQYTSPPELIDVVDETRQAAANAVRGVAPPKKSSEKSKSCANKSVLSYRTGHPRKRKRTVSAPSSATQEARPPSESSVSSRGRLQRAKQFDNFVV
ncbi:hypothetical protein AaE_015151 [Aphanomyces astaci]|uniref:SWIM-type domain-containing protein n=1 Tax=Aphanomyces astaci TaxID=112090 RepID=A0A6A4Z4E4_APHAT|nr:hypothetical protein AaE_015151 [Aphanomyces astaci]